MPTNNEINRRIAEFMEFCPDPDWVEEEIVGQNRWTKTCRKCGGKKIHGVIPQYTSPDSPRRLLDEVVAKIQTVEYAQPTAVVHALSRVLGRPKINLPMHNMLDLISATPEQIATAIYNVLTNGEEGKDAEKAKDER